MALHVFKGHTSPSSRSIVQLRLPSPMYYDAS